jgi:hypothetical protein
MAEYLQPDVELHESVVQALLSLQVMGAYTQPLVGEQESVVQTLLSLQAGLGVYVQPVVGAVQVSVVQALLSLQVMGV